MRRRAQVGKRRKGNKWREANAEDSKNDGRADLAMSPLGLDARDDDRATILLAGCDE
jgi:hypothetical protein